MLLLYQFERTQKETITMIDPRPESHCAINFSLPLRRSSFPNGNTITLENPPQADSSRTLSLPPSPRSVSSGETLVDGSYSIYALWQKHLDSEATKPPEQSPKPECPSASSLPPSEFSLSSQDTIVEKSSPYSIYTLWQKRLIVASAAFCGFYNPLTAQMYVPALNTLAEEFSVTAAEINLTVTTYMIFQGITPILFSGFTDVYGRRPGFILCFIVFIASNIALALVDEYSSLLVLRCIQSAGSATILILSQAVVADIITGPERGNYISLTAIPSILGPSLGPVIGGALTESLGWRSIFWFLTIGASVNFILVAMFLPETCRKVVGDGSIRPPVICRSLWQVITFNEKSADYAPNMSSLETIPGIEEKGTFSFIADTLFASFVLLRDLELLLLLLCGGIAYSGVYAIATAAPNLFTLLYGYDVLEIGLTYLPIAGGSIVGVFAVGPLMNRNYRRYAQKLNVTIDRSKQASIENFPIEKVRLQVGMPLLFLAAATTIAWGWAVANERPIPEVLTIVFFIGISLVGVNNSINALIVDLYPEKAGAALATYNLTKSLTGAAASGFVDPLIRGIGLGESFSLLGASNVLLVPIVVLIMHRGVAWRKGKSTSK